MPNVGMTVDARECFVLGVCRVCVDRQQRVDEVFVTIGAGVLSDVSVARFDLYWIVIILQGECHGVKETVVGFRQPFSCKIMRQISQIKLTPMALPP